MPIEKRRGDRVSCTIALEHKGGATRNFWGFALGTLTPGGAFEAYVGQTRPYSTDAHTVWTEESHSVSFELPRDMTPGDYYTKAGIWRFEPTSAAHWRDLDIIGAVSSTAIFTVTSEQAPLPGTPEITGIEPAPAAVGALIDIRGHDFDSGFVANELLYRRRGVAAWSGPVFGGEYDHTSTRIPFDLSALPAGALDAVGDWEISVRRRDTGLASPPFLLTLVSAAEFRRIEEEKYAWYGGY